MWVPPSQRTCQWIAQGGWLLFIALTLGMRMLIQRVRTGEIGFSTTRAGTKERVIGGGSRDFRPVGNARTRAGAGQHRLATA
jgi:hypothetical protein